MPTTIVQSPNVEGTISSCITNVSVILGTSRPNPFVMMSTGFATNSCTGETKTFESWEFTGLFYTLFAFAVIVGALWVTRYFLRN